MRKSHNFFMMPQILSARSAMVKWDSIAANTGQRVMQAAREAFTALAQRRGER